MTESPLEMHHHYTPDIAYVSRGSFAYRYPVHMCRELILSFHMLKHM